MSGVHDGVDPLLPAHFYHLFPGQEDTRVADDTVHHTEDLGIRVTIGRLRMLDRFEVISEGFDDIRVCGWEREVEVGHCNLRM